MMESLGVLSLGILLLASPVYASGPYVALFGDTLGGHGGSQHAICAINYIPKPYTTIEMWVWFVPDANGFSGCEFKISYPTTTYVLQGAVTSNPTNQAELGTLGAGMSVSVGEAFCQHDWYWTHWQELVVKSFAYRVVAVAGHPGNGGHIYVGDCTPGFPFEDATIVSFLILNGSVGPGCGDETRGTGWGAIKALYTAVE